MSVHIIIVNFNAGDWLLRSVSSALHSVAGRITVVDNNSSDTSVALVKEKLSDERLHWVENGTNKGFAAANNQVLAGFEEDFAVLLNPDCELHDDTLPRLLTAFDQHPRLALASCRVMNEAGEVHATSKRRFPTPWSALVRMLHLHKLFPNDPRFADFDYASAADAKAEFEVVEAVSGAFMVIRRTAIQEVGLLDEAYFMHCEDLDWCKRFQLAGWQVGYMGAVAVTHAKGVSSRSRPIGVLWNLHRGMARFFDNYYREQTSWPLRVVVKLGIFSSFALRAAGSVLRVRGS